MDTPSSHKAAHGPWTAVYWMVGWVGAQLAQAASMSAPLIPHTTTTTMDEVFHVPQTIAYCQSIAMAMGGRSDQDPTVLSRVALALINTPYDPKLTTPPGLYGLGVVISYTKAILLTLLYGGQASSTLDTFQSLCTNIHQLHYINLAVWAFGVLLIHAILKHHQCTQKMTQSVTFGSQTSSTSRTSWYALAQAITISLFPLHFFFSTLWYTDVPSTIFVLAAYLACLHQHYWFSSILSLLSLSFRQTNIIWTFFIAVQSVLQIIELDRFVSTSPRSFREILYRLWKCMPSILIRCGGYIACAVLFALFILKNGGIVLGDKSNHVPGFHVPQLYYFAAFACCFLWAYLPIKLVLRKTRQLLTFKSGVISISAVALALAVMVHTVRHYTIAHPFLLADNRHYTFYIWRWILAKPVFRYAFVPAYAVCWYVIFLWIQHNSLIWQITYLTCVAAVCIPSPLIECRYFILPFLFLRLTLPRNPHKWRSLLLEALTYSAVNVISSHLYWNRGFEWPSEPGVVQRFMW